MEMRSNWYWSWGGEEKRLAVLRIEWTNENWGPPEEGRSEESGEQLRREWPLIVYCSWNPKVNYHRKDWMIWWAWWGEGARGRGGEGGWLRWEFKATLHLGMGGLVDWVLCALEGADYKYGVTFYSLFVHIHPSRCLHSPQNGFAVNDIGLVISILGMKSIKLKIGWCLGGQTRCTVAISVYILCLQLHVSLAAFLMSRYFAAQSFASTGSPFKCMIVAFFAVISHCPLISSMLENSSKLLSIYSNAFASCSLRCRVSAFACPAMPMCASARKENIWPARSQSSHSRTCGMMLERSLAAAPNSLRLMRIRDVAPMASQRAGRSLARCARVAARRATEKPFWGMPALSKMRAFSIISLTRCTMSASSLSSFVARISRSLMAEE